LGRAEGESGARCYEQRKMGENSAGREWVELVNRKRQSGEY